MQIYMWRREYWALVRPDAVEALYNKTMRKILRWYYSVMEDQRPAKFMIAKTISSREDPKKLDLENLWNLHRELAKEFQSVFNEIDREDISFEEFRKRYRFAEPNFLDVKIEIAYRMLRECCFCERRCRVNRIEGGKGVCRLNTKVYVHSWFLHLGEEAPLVPSGTIFYGSCNFKCVYCQNWEISQEGIYNGVEVDARKLALIQKELRIEGARNINHVGGDPTPSAHVILESLKYLEINVPQLWNSNFYMTPELMELLKHVIDIWLPDFKYGNNECAKRLSRVDRYFEVVTRNLLEAINYGDMIIRHLVLPNHVECCSYRVLEWIAKNLPKDRVLVNIMDQYRPEYLVFRNPRDYPDISRRPHRDELERVYLFAEKMGLHWREVSR